MSFFQTHQGLASSQTIGVPLITSGIVSVLLSTTAILQWLRIRRLRSDLKDVSPSIFSRFLVDNKRFVADETEIPTKEDDAVIKESATPQEKDESAVVDDTPAQVTEIEVVAVESPTPEQDQELSLKIIVNEDTVSGVVDDFATADLKQTDSVPKSINDNEVHKPEIVNEDIVSGTVDNVTTADLKQTDSAPKVESFTDEKAHEPSVTVAPKQNLQDSVKRTDTAPKTKSINDNEVHEPEAMSFIEITKESIPSPSSTPPTSPIKVQIVDTEKLHVVSPVPSLPSTPLASPSTSTKQILKLAQSTDDTVTMTVASDEMNEISAHSVPTPTKKSMSVGDSKKYALDTSDMSVMSTITDASPTKKRKSKVKSFLKGARKSLTSSMKKLPSITH